MIFPYNFFLFTIVKSPLLEQVSYFKVISTFLLYFILHISTAREILPKIWYFWKLYLSSLYCLILNGDYFLTWFRFNSYVRLICSNKMSLFHNQLQSSPSKLLLQLTNVYRSYKPLLTDFDENMFFTETF